MEKDSSLDSISEPAAIPGSLPYYRPGYIGASWLATDDLGEWVDQREKWRATPPPMRKVVRSAGGAMPSIAVSPDEQLSSFRVDESQPFGLGATTFGMKSVRSQIPQYGFPVGPNVEESIKQKRQGYWATNPLGYGRTWVTPQEEANLKKSVDSYGMSKYNVYSPQSDVAPSILPRSTYTLPTRAWQAAAPNRQETLKRVAATRAAEQEKQRQSYYNFVQGSLGAKKEAASAAGRRQMSFGEPGAGYARMASRLETEQERWNQARMRTLPPRLTPMPETPFYSSYTRQRKENAGPIYGSEGLQYNPSFSTFGGAFGGGNIFGHI